MEGISVNGNILVDWSVFTWKSSAFGNRVYIDCRCIVPSCSSNALNIELVVPNRHVADWTGFIPLIGVVGQENGCHGHVKEFVSFDYNFVSCST